MNTSEQTQTDLSFATKMWKSIGFFVGLSIGLGYQNFPRILSSIAREYTTIFAWSGDPHQDLLSTVQTIAIAGIVLSIPTIALSVYFLIRRSRLNNEAMIDQMRDNNREMIREMKQLGGTDHPPAAGGRNGKERKTPLSV